ncbi:MAG: LamG-like jellyroll fold domain-containing protein, partial [Bacilli bacterium]
VVGTTTVVADTWYHIALTWVNNSTLKLFVNGVEEGSDSTGGTIGDTAYPIYAGRYTTSYTKVIMDEIRDSISARSSAWIKAEYNSGNNTLLSLGAEEETSEYTATYTPVLLSLVIPAITATAIVAATASFTPVALSQTIPAMTASYEAEYEANYTPLEISQTIPDFTASYIAEIEATYTPLEMSLVIPIAVISGITKLININKNSGVITAISKNTGNLKNINKS